MAVVAAVPLHSKQETVHLSILKPLNNAANYEYKTLVLQRRLVW